MLAAWLALRTRASTAFGLNEGARAFASCKYARSSILPALYVSSKPSAEILRRGKENNMLARLSSCHCEMAGVMAGRNRQMRQALCSLARPR